MNRLQFFDDSHRLQLQFTSPRREPIGEASTLVDVSADLHANPDTTSQELEHAQHSTEWECSMTEMGTEGMMEPWDQSSFFQQLYGQPATALDPVVQMYHMWDDGFQFIEEGSGIGYDT